MTGATPVSDALVAVVTGRYFRARVNVIALATIIAVTVGSCEIARWRRERAATVETIGNGVKLSSVLNRAVFAKYVVREP